MTTIILFWLIFEEKSGLLIVEKEVFPQFSTSLDIVLFNFCTKLYKNCKNCTKSFDLINLLMYTLVIGNEINAVLDESLYSLN